MATQGPRQQRLPVNYPATTQEITDAQRAGEMAASGGGSVAECPYRHAEDDRGRFLRLMWVRAFRHARAEERDRPS